MIVRSIARLRMAMLIPFFALCTSFVPIALAAQQAPVNPRATFRAVRHIATADGIDTASFVRIGGIEQWISVRSRHRDNPILLFLHGGPGFTSIPSSYYFMAGWDEYFTVVQWDQRGAGKTFGANSAEIVRPTMSIERMASDAEEVVEYLRRTYGRRKVLLVGHSWGTVLGVMLAQRHPDWFYAYVGISQFVDFRRSEAMGYQATLAAARAAGDRQAVAQLAAIAPYPDSAHPERDLTHLGQERRWLSRYGGYVWNGGAGGDGNDVDIARLSPDYTDADLQSRSAGLDFGLPALWADIAHVSFLRDTHFACPVIFMQGRHDRTTSAALLGEWYQRIDAPSKRLVWFEDSAHMLTEEEPAKVLVTLVDDALPLTHVARTTR